MSQVRTPINGLAIGVDLHKDTMTVCVLDTRSGEARFQKIACKCREQIVAFFKEIASSGPCVVAIESVGFYRWLWDLLHPIVDKLVLADASLCRRLAGRRVKTDRDDALNVAELLASGRLPLAYAPPPEVLALKDLTRYRNFVSRSHSRVAVRVRSLMNQVNRPGPRRLDAAGLTRYLKAQGDKLPERHALMMWLAVEQMMVLSRHLQQVERQIIEALIRAPGLSALARLLRGVPGVGPVVSATAIAEVGDFGRFPDRRAIVRYAGLCPRNFNSADSIRSGRICKTGPSDLRWVLQQAAWVAVRCHEPLGRMYEKIRQRRGWKVAIVAIARRLLVILWSVARRGRHYHCVSNQEASAPGRVAQATRLRRAGGLQEGASSVAVA